MAERHPQRLIQAIRVEEFRERYPLCRYLAIAELSGSLTAKQRCCWNV